MSNQSPNRRTFRKQAKLLRGAEFDAVFAHKCSSADQRLIVYARPNRLGYPRLGLVVSRKVGNAVRRNRWKRVLREAFRLWQTELPAVDLVCLPRMRAAPSLGPIAGSLVKLSTKAAKQCAARENLPREQDRLERNG